MTLLVLGANGSGKSAFAEKQAKLLSDGGGLFYIATMIPDGDEGLARVEKHRRQRAPFGFTTVEEPFRLSNIPLPPDAAALLEDVSNLLSNNMFDIERGDGGDGVYEDIASMCGRSKAAVLVSIAGLEASPEYDGGTRRYIEALGSLNARLSEFADAVVLMRGGMPSVLKGDAYALSQR